MFQNTLYIICLFSGQALVRVHKGRNNVNLFPTEPWLSLQAVYHVWRGEGGAADRQAQREAAAPLLPTRAGIGVCGQVVGNTITISHQKEMKG